MADYSYQPWHELHQDIEGIRLRDSFRSLTGQQFAAEVDPVSYTHLRSNETTEKI